MDKNEALDALRWPTRKAVGNLLRVMRGAGRSYDLADDFIELALAIQAAGRHTNALHIGEAISDVLHDAFRVECEKDGWTLAKDEIVRGALQRCASMLLHQNAQTSAGESEIASGVEMLARIRDRNKLESRQAISEPPRTKSGASKARAKPKVKLSPAQSSRSLTIKSVRPKASAQAPSPADPGPTGRPMTTVEFMRARARELARERDGK